MLGGVVGTHGAAREAIARAESRLFGGVSGDGRAASFRLRLLQDVHPTDGDQYTTDPQGWASYLCYGMGRTKDDERHRYAIPPNKRFKLELLCDDRDWPRLACLIRTWVLCGGLGARHRRGAGSLRWVNDPEHPTHPPDFNFLTGAREELKRQFGTVTVARAPDFDIIDPTWCRIRLCSRQFGSWQDALTAVRNQLRIPVANQSKARTQLQEACPTAALGGPRYISLSTIDAPALNLGANGFGWRQRWPPPNVWRLAGKLDRNQNRFTFPYYQGREHDLVSACGPGTILRNIRFGLPVAYSSWNKMVELELNTIKIRRPSPLCFRVYKTGTEYRVLVLLFRSAFLPGPALVTCGRSRVNDAGSYADLEAFVNACDGTDISFS